MKIIFKIAKNELLNLFYSPVAWFLAIVFLVQCAYFYMAALYPMTLQQDSMVLNVPGWKNWGNSLTALIFFNGDSIISGVYRNLYLFVPLLTMGLLSREVNSGTIKLLYSSPIKSRHIILGKYLAVMAYNLLLLAILGCFMVSGAFHIKAIDYGWLLSALLGFYLLVCAYSAIGLFMSGITTYQIVSAIGTFTIIFILSRIGTLWQKYDFVRDLTWFLSMTGRAEKMTGGLITTRDVIYFLIVILMFLSFTLFKLKGEKESIPKGIKTLRYLCVVVAGVLLGYVTSRPRFIGYWDTTAEKINTIAPETQQILKKMSKEQLEITLYANLFGAGLGNGLPENRNAAYLSTLWDKYLRFKPDIKFKYVYYYDNDGRLDDSAMYKSYPRKTEKQIAGIIAGPMELDSSMFIEPKEIRKQIDPYKENLRLFMTARYKGDTVNLRVYDDGEFWPNQQEIASKFKRLVDKKWPKVYYVTGNLERNIHKTGEREYSGHSVEKLNRSSLINQGFDVDTISLEKQDIPANITALVLADPKTELSAIAKSKLEHYIDKGGNILILGEPGKQMMLNPILGQLGVQLMKGQLVQINPNETPDKIIPYLPEAAYRVIQHGEVMVRQMREYKQSDTSAQTLMVGVAALSYHANGPFDISPILKTLPDGKTAASAAKSGFNFSIGGASAQKTRGAGSPRRVWLKMGHLVTDSVPPVFDPHAGDIKEPFFATAVSLTRQINNRQQRIIVLGDADYLSNLRLMWNVFGNNFYNWFDYGKYPVYIPLPVFKDTLLTITGPTARMLRTLYVWVLPGLLLLTGTILLIRRKRK